MKPLMSLGAQDLTFKLLLEKARVSFGIVSASQFSLAEYWFKDLLDVSASVKICVRMCGIKLVAGAWTATVRTHELQQSDDHWSCILGCEGEPDNMCPHLACPSL